MFRKPIKFYFWGLVIIVFAIIVASNIFFVDKKANENLLNGVQQFGPLKISDNTISGPGDGTFAPYMKIPEAKFYVSVVNDKFWCINDDCGLDGVFIQTMGGWLQADSVINYPDLPSMSGLDLEENQNVKSVVLIGDHDGKIVGIYPNGTLDDVLSILKKHPDLADFSFLNGVSEFGKLKVGEVAPLKPGNSIGYLSDALVKNSITRIPEDKKFYLFALQKRKYDIVGMYEKYENEYACLLEVGCRYPEPDPPHDFLFGTIDELNGWFLANDNDNLKMIELFGLDPQEVLSGKSSLVVLTDSNGIILAIHPNKTLSDTFTILSQYPELVDIEKL